MSLREAYSLAHTAQCRLQIAANRPDRNLRFVVGHLRHYESLRLRIVEIEHDVSTTRGRPSEVQFQGTGHVDHRLQYKPSTGSLRHRSPPPPPPPTYEDDDDDDDEEDDDDMYEDDDDTPALSLERFPSSASARAQPPPDLMPDDTTEDDDDDDDDDDDRFFDQPTSPEEPDRETLEKCIQSAGDPLMTSLYESVRKCRCHGKTDSAPSFERVWELPPDRNAKRGVTRAMAQVVAADPIAAA